MGIYDREYTRERRAYAAKGLFRGHSTVAVFIGLNVAVFILWHVVERGAESLDFSGDRSFMWRHFTVSADGVLRQFRLHTLFTSEFSHSEIWHLFWNMLFLWWFGTDLEEIYGSRNFSALYLFAGGAASLTHVLLDLSRMPALGASGAVMGIVIVAACFFPDRVIYLMGMIPIKLKWLALLYLLYDLVPVLDGRPDGVAHAAHLGGAAAGFLFYRLDLRFFSVQGERSEGWARLRRTFLGWLTPGREREGAPRPTLGRCLRNLFRRTPRLRVVERRAPDERGPVPRVPPPPVPPPGVDPRTAEHVDELLKKISEGGIGALTDAEREFLQASSEKYRR